MKTKKQDSDNIQIIVAQRGWVAVGRVEQDGHDVHLHDARIIRRWGTERGLGQLSEDGPTPETVLDAGGHISLHEYAVVLRFHCNSAVWDATLSG